MKGRALKASENRKIKMRSATISKTVIPKTMISKTLRMARMVADCGNELLAIVTDADLAINGTLVRQKEFSH
jgi:hypothetical protein